MIRYGVLSAIGLSIKIYDPVSVQEAYLGPDETEKDYIRIEAFAEKLPQHIDIKEIRNEKIKKSRFYFTYQPYGEPRLAELRKKYRLDEVTAQAANDFEAAVLLRNWTRSRFRRRDYHPKTDNFDALAVLDNRLRNNDNEAFDPDRHIDPCYFFPFLFSQVAVSMGYQARIVQISFSGYGGHGMAEIWSDHYQKWIAVDAELNLHYEKDGVPLNLLEIHNERYETAPSRMKIIRGEQHSGDESTTKVFLGLDELDVNSMIRYHSYFRIMDMRNDWVSHHYFKGHPRRSDLASLFFKDPQMPHVFNLSPETDRKEDVYWTLNQTEIFVKNTSEEQNSLSLAFKTFTPNFRQFEIQTDDSEKILSDFPGFVWKLHPGKNRLQVRSVNQYGHCGIPSSAEIILKKEALP